MADHPTNSATWDIGETERVPDAVLATAMRCIATWSLLDAERVKILGALLGNEDLIVLSMFQSVHSGYARSKMLRDAAREALRERESDMERLEFVMDRLSDCEKDRNALAHGIFCGSDREFMLWPAHYYAQVHAAGMTHARGGVGRSGQSLPAPVGKSLNRRRWNQNRLNQCLQRMRRCLHYVQCMTLSLYGPDHPAGAQARRDLDAALGGQPRSQSRGDAQAGGESPDPRPPQDDPREP